MLKTLEDTAIRPAPDFNQFLKVLTRKGKPSYVPFYELLINTEFIEKLLGENMPSLPGDTEFFYRAGYDYVPVWVTCRTLLIGDTRDNRKKFPVNDRKDFDAYRWPVKNEITYENFDKASVNLHKGMNNRHHVLRRGRAS